MTGNALTGAVALVTGASSGIGAATALRLAQEGAAVGVVGRRRQRLDGLADDVAAAGGTALVIEADITDPDRAAEAIQVTLDRFGRLDVLVNNAGIMVLGTALHATLEDWDRMIALNVDALLHVTHAAVPYLIDAAATSPRGVSDIVNVGSTAGRVARPASSVFTLTKFGLNGFTEALRQELLVERVRVSVVEPGTVSTELVNQLGDAARDTVLQLVNGIEPLRPEDIADAIAYVVTRERRVAVNGILVRAVDQTW
ncbi:NADP-dependent 3-hydroxy acid dehydrogenase YdfG [Kribbella antiqua]|uniref:NADP-dependent 3-hydroxy acid dehydrogenase YdfG n=1 Tax=Kribbella antiqua TaxID=2512217 RepID=A0A4R2IEW7_9ACTN|nr:SDR family NAD(P)-dependent oxidoreductase [Kribbella antiqua]TCO42339.1 NADP-dependent 3-hydroxy acid dehydrogenase YdfG [Kribbella antiqua]